MKYRENFKNILKDLRLKNNITQKKLATATGIPLSMISKYEQGTNKPSLNYLMKLALFFNVETSIFLEKDDLYSELDPKIFTEQQELQFKLYSNFWEYLINIFGPTAFYDSPEIIINKLKEKIIINLKEIKIQNDILSVVEREIEIDEKNFSNEMISFLGYILYKNTKNETIHKYSTKEEQKKYNENYKRKNSKHSD